MGAFKEIYIDSFIANDSEDFDFDFEVVDEASDDTSGQLELLSFEASKMTREYDSLVHCI